MKIKLILFLLFIITILLQYNAPSTYSPNFCFICFLCIIYPAIKIIYNDTKIIGILNFNNLFLSSFFLTSFAFAVFIYPIYGNNSPLFLFVDLNVINKCTAISAMAFLSYSIGYSLNNNKYTNKTIFNYNIISKRIKPFYWFSCIIILLSSIFFIRNNDGDIQVGIGSYFTILLLVSSSIYFIAQAHTDRNKNFISFVKKNKIILSSLLIIALIYLLIGDRGLVIQIMVLLFSIYSVYYKKIKIAFIIPILLSGVLLMYSVRITRQGEQSLRHANVSGFLEQSQEVYVSSDFNMWTPFSDLTERYIELYLGYQIQERQGGYIYPLKIFSVLVSPIPVLPNILNNLIYDIPLSETSVGKSVGDYYDFHAGNNCIIAIYAPWGWPGIIILFFLFGYFIKYFTLNKSNSFYNAVFYVIILYMAVYLPRSSILDIYRPIIWALILIKFCNHKSINKQII